MATTSSTTKLFYKLSISAENINSEFYPEYSVLMKTVEAVNSFNSLYKVGRTGAKGGPSTHAQQDLYRAMLVFACAGLDVLVKQFIKNKLPRLLTFDSTAKNQFKEYIRGEVSKNEKTLLNTIALSLIDRNPRRVFLSEYVKSMTNGSLQSLSELRKIAVASGLNDEKIFNKDRSNALKDVFAVRNQIIHEMDINVTSNSDVNPRAFRTRRQRVATKMEAYTKIILELGEDFFSEYKNKFEKLEIDIPKKASKITEKAYTPKKVKKKVSK